MSSEKVQATRICLLQQEELEMLSVKAELVTLPWRKVFASLRDTGAGRYRGRSGGIYWDRQRI